MKVVTYNIHYAVGKDLRYDIERIVDAVRDADIIALQEVERNYGPGRQCQPEVISGLLPDYYWVYGAAFDIDASTKDSLGKVCNRRKQHGQMILSRSPILTRRYFPLPRLGIDHTCSFQMGVLEGLVDAPRAPLRVYAVHFGSVESRERQEQAHYLRRLVNEVPTRGGAWTGPAEAHADRDWSDGAKPCPMPVDAIILGDFNMAPDTPEYQLVTSDDPIDGSSGFIDARSCESEPGGSPTWSPLPNRSDEFRNSMRLDYCFVTSSLSERIEASWIDGEAPGSDHQPVWLTLGNHVLP